MHVKKWHQCYAYVVLDRSLSNKSWYDRNALDSILDVCSEFGPMFIGVVEKE